MKDKGFYRSILRLALPAAFQSLMSLLVTMADNLMVSSLDPHGLSLAAVAQSNSITNFVNAALLGLSAGAAVLVSQYWGKRDTGRIKPLCATAFTLTLSFSALIVLSILAFPSLALSLVIGRKEEAIAALAIQYLPVLVFSYLPFAFTAACIAILRGVEVVRVTLYATIGSLISNVTLNYILIFGKLGFPALGVKGAAIATVLARLIEAGIVVFYLFRVQKVLPLRPKDLMIHRGWAWKDYTRFGLPVGLTDAQWALIGILKMMIIGRMGQIMINAAAVTDMLFNLGTLFTFALAGGAAVLVGKAAGTGDVRLVRQYSKRIQIMFLFVGIMMAALVFFLRAPFFKLYDLDAQTLSLALTMAGICAPTLIGTSYHASCFVGINRGAGDSRFVMLVDMICGWLIVLPSAFMAAFVLKLPLHWVYFSTRIDQSFKWIIAFLRLRGDRWIYKLTREDTQ